MSLIRLLLIALAAWLVWRLILQPRLQALQSRQRPPPQVRDQTMVRCRHCALHIPLADALKKDADYYCSQQCLEAEKDAG